MGNFFESIFKDLVSLFSTDFLRVIRTAVIILDAFLIIGIVSTFKKALKTRPKFLSLKKLKQASGAPRIDAYIKEQWDRIMKHASGGTPQEFTLAIIDADKLVDEVLKTSGVPGDQMADKLEWVTKKTQLKTADKIWQAHRIRNELVHTTGFKISERDARNVLNAYQEFFKEIGAFS